MLTFIPTKKTVFTLLFFAAALAVIAVIGAVSSLFLSVNDASSVRAAPADSQPLFGWAWSDNFGWISFNCEDRSSCGSVDYSVSMDADGDLSGYAWSDNFGWVSFNAGDLSGCPQGACKAKLAGNNLQGWGRVLSYGDGWDGWISLNGPNYGITLNDPNFEGFAWDASKNDPGDPDEQAIGSGWIQFNPEFGGVTIKPQCSDGIDNDGDGLFDYPDDPDCDNEDDNNENGGGDGKPQCSDEADNDGDGKTDEEDPGCHTDGNAGNPGSYNPNDNNETDVPQCSDGIDNDGNGCADFLGGDTGCTSPSDTTESGGSCPLISFQCSDEADNDGDVKIDEADPGCYNTGGYDPSDDDEEDTPLPQCSNFFDDDGDGLTDYKADGTGDPGCSSGSDNREFSINFQEF